MQNVIKIEALYFFLGIIHNKVQLHFIKKFENNQNKCLFFFAFLSRVNN